MDEISKNNYDNKFKSIEGAIAEADDAAALLDKNFPFFDNAIMTTEVAYILAIMYDCLFKVCDVLEKDKKDSLIKQYPPEQIPYGSIKELRNTISIRHASPSTFIKEDIMQLLNYIKYVIKDCKSNITFDDCITINTLIGLSKRDLEKLTTSKHDRKMVLGKHYILDISDDKVEDDSPDPVEEVKEAKTEVKPEIKEEPKPEVKEETAKPEFVFERKAPEPAPSEPVKEAEPGPAVFEERPADPVPGVQIAEERPINPVPEVQSGIKEIIYKSADEAWASFKNDYFGEHAEELAEAFNQKDEMDFRLEELKKCMEYAQETDINELNYQMGMCYYSLQQSGEARELLNKFLDATVNKEYNDKIKYQREQAQRALRMMMW